MPLTRPMVTDMRATDTSGQGDLFGASGAVSPLIGAPDGLRRGDVDSTTGRRTSSTTTGPGCRTSAATAIRTTTASRTSIGRSSSAGENAARHAGFSFELLVAALEDCRRYKRNSVGARQFEMHQGVNLYALYTELLHGTYRPGPPTCFVITHPKPREILAAPFRDRIVHHLLYNHVQARFHRSFIVDSCACIPGRGTAYAAERLEAKIRSITQNWKRRAFYLKLDLSSFFVSIKKPELRALLAAKISEPWWMALTDLILMHDPRHDVVMHTPRRLLERVPEHKRLLNQSADTGLPIGNLSSQFFANVYLNPLDQHVKHRIGARHYIRYVDDFILLHEDPAWLNAALAEISRFLEERLRVRINPKKTILQPVARGVDFVGQLVKPWRRTLRPRTVRTALRRCSEMPADSLHVTANSYFGLLRQAPNSHVDRARLANVLLGRGHVVDGSFTKTFRAPAK